MAFFRKLFQSGGKSKKKDYPNIIQGVDPLESWQKVGELGDGAFGKVFKTEHRESGKMAAMKRVPIQDDLELDDFMVEIDILAEFKHRTIVGLHEAYFYDQALWIYIEFCAGGAVDDIIVELDHGLSEKQICCIAKQMFEGLSFLHASQCIHRDIKAGNILLCPDGSIRLADFGVSTKDNVNRRQRHDTFIGTPYWMAPEVVVCETIKDDPYDSSADIWSVGITFIELADMNPPYHEMSPMRVLQKVVKKDPPTLAVPSRWSRDFSDIIAKCLAKAPSSRPSAASLLEHPFIAGVTDNKPLRILYQEVKSEVQEIVEELPEDADLSTDPGHSEQLLSEPSEVLLPPRETPPPPKEPPPPSKETPPPPKEPPPPFATPPPPKEPPPPSKEPAREPTPPSREPTPREPTPSSLQELTPLPTVPPPSPREPTPSLADPSPLDSTPSPPPSKERPPDDSSTGPEPVVIPEPMNSDLGPEPEPVAMEPGGGRTSPPEQVPVRPEPVPSPPVPRAPVQSPVSEPSPSPVADAEQNYDRERGLQTVNPLRQGDESSLSSELSTPGEDKPSRRVEHKYATLSRVRKFKVDGQTIETTTRKIVDVTANKTLRDNRRYQQMRKQDFRELKQLQREEMKEATEFYGKIKVDREVQDRKFEVETGEIERRYDIELESISKRQKKEVIRQEGQHIQQFKSKMKLVKSHQSKDVKRFKENLKEEEKLAVKRVEVSSAKSERKVAVNRSKLELQYKRVEKEAVFGAKQVENTENEVKQILNLQKEERKILELSFLDARQDLRRNHTSLLWEMEQRQKQDHHQLLKQQLREAFHMQRHQMHMRHQTEVELQSRRDQFQLEELRQKQLLEKRQLPKKLKSDHKAKVTEVRKAIRSKKGDKDTLRKLDEQYIQLSQLETELMNERHDKEMETLRAELEFNMRELQEIQNEKKMQLTQQETNKVKERDNQHTVDLREWRGEIAKQKQKLEEDFKASREEQEQFYSLDRPIPKQLRLSLALPGGSISKADRAMKVRSTTSLDPVETGARGGARSRPPLQSLDEVVLASASPMKPLDEVVMGTPVLSHTPAANSDNSALQNGNSK